MQKIALQDERAEERQRRANERKEREMREYKKRRELISEAMPEIDRFTEANNW